MLNSNSPAYKSACLKCIKKLLLYPQIVKQLLSDSVASSHLLVGACQHPEFEIRKELQSEHNVSLFLQFVNISDPEAKIQFLHLLVELRSKSQTTQNLIRSDGMQLPTYSIRWLVISVSCISDNHPDGVPLPPSPSKETAINTLVDILTFSLDIEERSIAAAIISQLPKDDIIIDELLKKSEALKAIREFRDFQRYYM
ncbi:hypothetical protein Peur_056909 [Populus x canadensis]